MTDCLVVVQTSGTNTANCWCDRRDGKLLGPGLKPRGLISKGSSCFRDRGSGGLADVSVFLLGRVLG